MSTAEFLDQFREFLGRNGYPPSDSPWTLVEEWESLIDDVEEGYELDIYEFRNDLSVRDLLEKVFTDPQFAGLAPVAHMRARVAAADTRLRAAFVPEVVVGPSAWPWWRRGVLARAARHYAEDAMRHYNVKVDSPA